MSDDTYTAASDAWDGTIELVSAYVSNTNTHLTAEQFQTLIRETFATLSSLDVSPAASEPETTAPDRKSKAEIKKSIGDAALISFEDGKPYKSLKRHLGTRGLTPEEYRAKWGLPSDYPMVHPAYSAQRSELARAIGLGSKGRQAKAVVKPAPKTRKPRQLKA
jgi:predicted transcriptional regulator